MAGAADGIVPDRVRTQAQEEEDGPESAIATFLRRSGGDQAAVLGKSRIEEGADGFSQLKEQFDETLSISDPTSKGVGGRIRALGGGLLAGNKFGVVKTEGGVPFAFNPLKAITSGFHASQKYLGDPFAGQVIGWSTTLAAGIGAGGVRLPGAGSSLGETAAKFKLDVRSGEGSFWMDGGDFQSERDSLFWGEKFFSTILLDPLNFVGFGVMGKIPIVGRTALRATTKIPLTGKAAHRMEFSLGGLENGYVGAVNMPFKMAGKLFTKFPGIALRGVTLGKVGSLPSKARNQLIADAGARATDVWRNAAAMAAGGTSHTLVTKDQITHFAAVALNRQTKYSELPSDVHRRFRTLVDEAPPLTRKEVQSMSKAVGSKRVITRHERFRVDSLVDDVISGRASGDETPMSVVVRILGGDPQNADHMDAIASRVSAMQRARHEAADMAISESTVEKLEKSLRTKSMYAIRRLPASGLILLTSTLHGHSPLVCLRPQSFLSPTSWRTWLEQCPVEPASHTEVWMISL